MYEDFSYDLEEVEMPEKKPVVAEKDKPIPQGKVVTLQQLMEREWSMGRVDANVRNKSLQYLPGKNAYMALREIY